MSRPVDKQPPTACLTSLCTQSLELITRRLPSRSVSRLYMSGNLRLISKLAKSVTRFKHALSRPSTQWPSIVSQLSTITSFDIHQEARVWSIRIPLNIDLLPSGIVILDLTVPGCIAAVSLALMRNSRLLPSLEEIMLADDDDDGDFSALISSITTRTAIRRIYVGFDTHAPLAPGQKWLGSSMPVLRTVAVSSLPPNITCLEISKRVQFTKDAYSLPLSLTTLILSWVEVVTKPFGILPPNLTKLVYYGSKLQLRIPQAHFTKRLPSSLTELQIGFRAPRDAGEEFYRSLPQNLLTLSLASHIPQSMFFALPRSLTCAKIDTRTPIPDYIRRHMPTGIPTLKVEVRDAKNARLGVLGIYGRLAQSLDSLIPISASDALLRRLIGRCNPPVLPHDSFSDDEPLDVAYSDESMDRQIRLIDSLYIKFNSHGTFRRVLSDLPIRLTSLHCRGNYDSSLLVNRSLCSKLPRTLTTLTFVNIQLDGDKPLSDLPPKLRSFCIEIPTLPAGLLDFLPDSLRSLTVIGDRVAKGHCGDFLRSLPPRLKTFIYRSSGTTNYIQDAHMDRLPEKLIYLALPSGHNVTPACLKMLPKNLSVLTFGHDVPEWFDTQEGKKK